MVRSTNDTPYDFLQIAGDKLVSLAFELKVRWFYFFYYYLDFGGCSESLFKSQSGLVWHFGKLTSTYLIKKYLTHLLVRLRIVSTLLQKMPFMHVLIYLHIYYWLKIKCSNHIKLPTPLRVWRHQIDQQNKSSRLCLCKLYHLKHNVQDEKNTGTVKRYGNSLIDPKSSIIALQLVLFFFIVCVYACSLSHFLCSVQLVIEEFILMFVFLPPRLASVFCGLGLLNMYFNSVLK